MKDTARITPKETLESIEEICRKCDFFCNFTENEKYANPLVKKYSLTREYAVPECIGQMIKVKYIVEMVLFDSESDFEAESFINVFFEADMFRKSCDAKLMDSGKFFQVYFNDLRIEFKDDDLSNYIACTERVVNEMFDLTEKRLGNILGMVRIA